MGSKGVLYVCVYICPPTRLVGRLCEKRKCSGIYVGKISDFAKM